MPALNHVGTLPRHVVAQIIETEFVVRSVGDVSVVLLATNFWRLVRDDATNCHAERTENTTHQFRLVGREVVVGRDDVNTTSRDRIEVTREGCHEGLTFTGLHFGDVAEVKRGTTHDLNVIVTETKGTFGCLANGGECFGQKVIQGFACGITIAELNRLVSQFVVGELGEIVFEGVDNVGISLEFAQNCALARAQDFIQQIRHS